MLAHQIPTVRYIVLSCRMGLPSPIMLKVHERPTQSLQTIGAVYDNAKWRPNFIIVDANSISWLQKIAGDQ